MKSIKNILPEAVFSLLTLVIGLSFFLAGCGESQSPQVDGVLSRESDFSTEIPRGLQKNRTGLNLTAELVIDDGTPIPLSVDFADETVSGATASDLKPGTHTFKKNGVVNLRYIVVRHSI